jgi:hypothetical protein
LEKHLITPGKDVVDLVRFSSKGIKELLTELKNQKTAEKEKEK